jgi:hypothetical protein
MYEVRRINDNTFKLFNTKTNKLLAPVYKTELTAKRNAEKKNCNMKCKDKAEEKFPRPPKRGRMPKPKKAKESFIKVEPVRMYGRSTTILPNAKIKKRQKKFVVRPEIKIGNNRKKLYNEAGKEWKDFVSIVADMYYPYYQFQELDFMLNVGISEGNERTDVITIKKKPPEVQQVRDAVNPGNNGFDEAGPPPYISNRAASILRNSGIPRFQRLNGTQVHFFIVNIIYDARIQMKAAIPEDAVRKSFFDGKFNFKNLFSFDVSKQGRYPFFHSFTKSPNFNKGITDLIKENKKNIDRMKKALLKFIENNARNM